MGDMGVILCLTRAWCFLLKFQTKNTKEAVAQAGLPFARGSRLTCHCAPSGVLSCDAHLPVNSKGWGPIINTQRERRNRTVTVCPSSFLCACEYWRSAGRESHTMASNKAQAAVHRDYDITPLCLTPHTWRLAPDTSYRCSSLGSLYASCTSLIAVRSLHCRPAGA